MALITSTCPSCKEIIKLDDSKPFGFCLSCGERVQISTTTQQQGPGTGQLIDNYYKLAENANKASKTRNSIKRAAGKIVLRITIRYCP